MEDKYKLSRIEAHEEEIKEKQEKMKKEMNAAGIEAVIRTEVKKFSKSAHITLPKQYIGKKAVVLVVNEEKMNANRKPSDTSK